MTRRAPDTHRSNLAEESRRSGVAATDVQRDGSRGSRGGWIVDVDAVDRGAFWQAADLRLEPHSQVHDGTLKTMNSVALAEKQAQYIHQQIAGRPYNLLAGTHKDVVWIPTAFGKPVNKPGIYGWHKSATDRIQQEMWGHSLDWKDYSQGLRLVKRV